MKSFFVHYQLRLFLPLLFIVALVYLLFVTQGTFHFMEYRQGIYYNWLAKVFLSGHTGVSMSSPEAIPTADGSIYHNVLYLYWGPVPALIHAGYRLLTNQILYSSVLTYIAAILNIFFFWVTLVNLAKRLLGKVNWPLLLLLTALYAVGATLFNVTRSFIYEEALVVGSTFLLASLAVITSPNSASSAWYSLSAGVLFSLAVSTRVSLLFFLPLLLGYDFVLSQRPFVFRFLAKRWLTFLLPLFIALSLLGYYNYARFGSSTEFGISYLNVGKPVELERIKAGETMSWRYIPYNSAYYFLAPVYYSGTGEYRAGGWRFPNTIGDYPRLSGVEYTSSIFFLSPLLLFVVGSWRYRQYPTNLARYFLITNVGLGLFLIFGLLMYFGNGYRYFQDFSFIFYWLSYFVISRWLDRLPQSRKRLVYILLVVISIYTLSIGLKQTCSVWLPNSPCIRLQPIDQFHLLG